MMAVPPSVLERLQLKVGTLVDIDVEKDCVVARPRNRPRYSLAELLDQCNADIALTNVDRAWLDAPAVGRELP